MLEVLFDLDGISGAQGSVSGASDTSALGASVASANISNPSFLSREKDGCDCCKADS